MITLILLILLLIITVILILLLKRLINYIKNELFMKENNNNVLTQKNFIVSVITAGISFLITVTTGNIFLLIAVVYTLFWAYLSRYVGLKKGIDIGYVWGYLLGMIGFIIVCVVQGEGKEQEEKGKSTEYTELETLFELKEKGAITQEEFDMKKRELLGL